MSTDFFSNPTGVFLSSLQSELEAEFDNARAAGDAAQVRLIAEPRVAAWCRACVHGAASPCPRPKPLRVGRQCVSVHVSPGSQRRAVGQGKTDVVRVLAESGQVAVNHAGAGCASALWRAALNGDAACTRQLSAG